MRSKWLVSLLLLINLDLLVFVPTSPRRSIELFIELIVLIFVFHLHYTLEADDWDLVGRMWIANTHVCNRWRTISIDNAQLWRVVGLHILPHEKLLPAVFSRSGSMQLMVTVVEGWSAQSLRILGHDFDRVKCLAIEAAFLERITRENSQMSTSVLQYVHIVESIPDCLGRGGRKWTTALPLFHTLTSLRISGIHVITRFLETVAGVTVDDTLELSDHTILTTPSPINARPHTVLPHLSRLRLDGLDRSITPSYADPSDYHRNVEVSGARVVECGEDIMETGCSRNDDVVNSVDLEEEPEDTEGGHEVEDDSDTTNNLAFALLMQLGAFVRQRDRAKLPIRVLHLEACSATCYGSSTRTRTMDTLGYSVKEYVECVRCGNKAEKDLPVTDAGLDYIVLVDPRRPVFKLIRHFAKRIGIPAERCSLTLDQVSGEGNNVFFNPTETMHGAGFYPGINLSLTVIDLFSLKVTATFFLPCADEMIQASFKMHTPVDIILDVLCEQYKLVREGAKLVKGPVKHKGIDLTSYTIYATLFHAMHYSARTRLREYTEAVQIASDLHLEFERPRKSPSQYELPAKTPNLVIRGGRWTRSCFCG
ncbi:uncharacterized protein STEHIDRAFT_113741 [Stereum hirsutum FP-91666 SS1]|uniref:uncharacterized protein n=1 Tax=Stereum hirsutum (strain FP-91666) TaxID=721885 RepID=UPI0004449494|nr:uncharacterized protein STEHIDRAFT_113741 [Stereum hirsutum FP-91666 SS1]EIM83672.1 hypothetical protein STEHIDRAFT_113741 [Stereum hirsutum FP-91666 SS1]